MTFKISVIILLTFLTLSTIVSGMEVNTSKTNEGVETTTKKSIWVFFGENNQKIGYATVTGGVIFCLCSLIGFFRKNKQEGFILQGESELKSKLKVNFSFEISLVIVGGILILLGLIFTRIQFVYGLII